MRGHERLVALRRHGIRPPSVWLTDAPPPQPLADGTRLDWWAFTKPLPPEVSIDPADSPLRADLRFVVGLTVHVMLDDSDRMAAWVQACRDAGAARVFGSSHAVQVSRGGDVTAAEVAFEGA